MQSISYIITPISLSEHLFEVSLHIPQHSDALLTLALPAWIPGSYMIRDFARNLHNIKATDNEGLRLDIAQHDKQTWQVSTGGKSCEVTYTIYAFDLSVRSAYISDEYGFFNGTSTFLYVREMATYACKLTVQQGSAPSTWKIATSLTKQASKNIGFGEFTADNYQELIDHPVLIGDYSHQTFAVQGVNFHMVLTGNPATDIDKICTDLVPLCEHHLSLFDGIPCKDYWFLTLLSDDGFGGLEHRASTALLFPRFHLPLPHEFETRSEQYQQFLSLCSHELFHTWHVKKIRPKNMLNPDLSQEVYTEQLWIYEGFTSLYDDLSLARTQLITPERYACILAEAITRLLRTPGRHSQTIAESSFNAWSKFYKQDAGSVNHIVSYYNKGAIISLCLDITLRQLSNNAVTIDHLIQALWTQYGIAELGTDNDVIQTVCKTSFNIDIAPFLNIAVHTTMDLPLNTLLESIGLSMSLRAKESNTDKGGTIEKANSVIDFGATFKASDTGIAILNVTSQSAAANAGIQVGDKLIALGQWQVTADNFLRLLNSQTIDSSVKLHILRQGRLLELSLTARRAPLDTCVLDITDKPKFMQWIGI